MFNLNFQLFNGSANNPTILNWPLLTTLIPAKATDGNYTFTRASSSWSVDHEGVLRKALADQARFSGARVVRNLAIGLTTQSVAVEVGRSYQVVIKGDTGDTCVCTGSFTGTLTANGTDRISWNSGIPKVATTTSITLTVIGTLTELSVEDVTNQTIKTPGEHLDSATSYGQGIDGVKSFDTTNANTVDANGVVTEIPGVPITGIKGFLYEPQRTNKCENYNVIGADMLGSELVNLDLFTFIGGSMRVGDTVVLDGTMANYGSVYSPNSVCEKGKIYQVSFTYSGTGSLRIRPGTSNCPYLYLPDGSHQYTCLSDAPGNIRIQVDSSNPVGTVSNISVKEIGAADVNTGLFKSGLGTGAQAFHDGTVFQNPIPGMTLSGDVAAILSIVDDSAELEAAGRLTISHSGKVYKLDNSLGSVNATATYTGSGVNLTNHMSHVMSRSGGASTVGVGISNVTGSTPVAGITYANAEFGGVLVNATDESNIVAAGGEVLYFLLNQLEEGSAVTSKIITQGTSATRAKDDLQLPVADGVNFSQKEGMFFCDWIPQYDQGDATNFSILSTKNGITFSFIGGGSELNFTDGTNYKSNPIPYTVGNTYKLGGRWAPSVFQAVYEGVATTIGAYDGAFPLINNYRIGYNAAESFNLKNIIVLKKDKGEAYAITETTP